MFPQRSHLQLTSNEEQRRQVIEHVYRSRIIYETIVSNMRNEDDMLIRALSDFREQNPSTPPPIVRMSAGIRQPSSSSNNQSSSSNNQSSSSNNQSSSSNNQSRLFARNNPIPNSGYVGVQRTSNRQMNGNPFQGLFLDVASLLFNNPNENTNSVESGLSNDIMSVIIRQCVFYELPQETRERYTTCPITLDHFEDNTEVALIRSCGHVFRRDALMNWLSTRHTCPACRHNLNEPHYASTYQWQDTSNNIANVTSTHSVNTTTNPTVTSTHQTPTSQMNINFESVVGIPNTTNDIHNNLFSIINHFMDPSLTNLDLSGSFFTDLPVLDFSGNDITSIQSQNDEDFRQLMETWYTQRDISNNN